jgi:hypothetical protein
LATADLTLNLEYGCGEVKQVGGHGGDAAWAYHSRELN